MSTIWLPCVGGLLQVLQHTKALRTAKQSLSAAYCETVVLRVALPNNSIASTQQSEKRASLVRAERQKINRI